MKTLLLLCLLLLVCTGAMAEVTAVAAGENGRLWIATDAGVLLTFDSTRFEKVAEFPEAIRAVMQDRGGKIWIGTAGGLIRYSDRANVLAKSITALRVDRKGNFWVGTREGAGILKDGNFTITIHNFVSSFAEDKDGSLWIGSGQDLLCYRNGKTDMYSLPPPPANVRMMPQITGITVHPAGGIWVGTRNGMLRFQNGKFSAVKELQDLQVLSLYSDANSRLWIGTAEALILWEKMNRTRYELP